MPSSVSTTQTSMFRWPVEKRTGRTSLIFIARERLPYERTFSGTARPSFGAAVPPGVRINRNRGSAAGSASRYPAPSQGRKEEGDEAARSVEAGWRSRSPGGVWHECVADADVSRGRSDRGSGDARADGGGHLRRVGRNVRGAHPPCPRSYLDRRHLGRDQTGRHCAG